MKKQGFTILELILVVGIIVTLSVLVLVSVQPVRATQRDARRLADVAQIAKAMEFFISDRSVYPDCPFYRVFNCNVSGATGPGLANYLGNVANMKDPSGSTTRCGGASAAVCDYGFGAYSPTTYTLFFYTENPLPATGQRCNKRTPTGIFACP